MLKLSKGESTSFDGFLLTPEEYKRFQELQDRIANVEKLKSEVIGLVVNNSKEIADIKKTQDELVTKVGAD